MPLVMKRSAVQIRSSALLSTPRQMVVIPYCMATTAGRPRLVHAKALAGAPSATAPSGVSVPDRCRSESLRGAWCGSTMRLAVCERRMPSISTMSGRRTDSILHHSGYALEDHRRGPRRSAHIPRGMWFVGDDHSTVRDDGTRTARRCGARSWVCAHARGRSSYWHACWSVRTHRRRHACPSR